MMHDQINTTHTNQQMQAASGGIKKLYLLYRQNHGKVTNSKSNIRLHCFPSCTWGRSTSQKHPCFMPQNDQNRWWDMTRKLQILQTRRKNDLIFNTKVKEDLSQRRTNQYLEEHELFQELLRTQAHWG